MSWPALFLGCFVVGLALTVLSFALSAVHLHFHVHVPFLHHLHGPHVHLTHAVGARGGIDAASPLNFATMTAFLAWFGGTGYLLTTQFGWVTAPALVLASLSGLLAASVVFWVMVRLLWSPHENMRAADYDMIGVLGRIGNPIRSGGTGELIYSHGGTRHSCGARSADGHAIDKGMEVVVTAYDRGIAYVRRWDEMAQGG